MRERSIATAACPAIASQELPLRQGHRAGRRVGIEEGRARRPDPRTVASGTCSHVAAGQRVRSAARRLLALQHPGRRRPLGLGQLDVRRMARPDRQPTASGIRMTACAPNCRADVLDDHPQQVLEPDGCRDLARERIERGGPALPPPRRIGLVADARRELAREHGHERGRRRATATSCGFVTVSV